MGEYFEKCKIVEKRKVFSYLLFTQVVTIHRFIRGLKKLNCFLKLFSDDQ